MEGWLPESLTLRPIKNRKKTNNWHDIEKYNKIGMILA